MLILAGITISSLTGSGLFEKVTTAKQQHEIGYAKEKIILALYEYEATLKKETLYSVLNKIEGLQAIDPDEETVNIPCIVVVDGYEFSIEEKEVKYLREASDIVPEVVSINSNVISKEDVKIEFVVKTEDTRGIKEIILLKNGTIVDRKTDVSGQEVTGEFNATGNGTYEIIVKGNNRNQTKSDPVQVTEMTIVSGTLKAGTIQNGSVLLTVNAEVKEAYLSKIEIYQGTNKINEITCEENIQTTEKTYQVDYIPFYQENTYTAKIIASDNESTTTTAVKAKNTDTIKTQTDLNKLASLVNAGTTFSGKTINLIADISTGTGYLPIGYYDGGAEITGKYFSGVFNGNNHSITINSITTNTLYQSIGIFGMIKNGEVKNLNVKGNIDSTIGVTAGLVGVIQNGNIQNCKNYATVNSTKNSIGGICACSINSTIKNSENNGKITAGQGDVGGISGWAKNTTFQNCKNTKDIISGSWNAGGIVGSGEYASIYNSENSGYIEVELYAAAGVMGLEIGIGKIQNCKNSGEIFAKVDNAGGILGCIDNAVYNLTESYTIDGCVNIGYIHTDRQVAGGIVGVIKENAHLIVKNSYNNGVVNLSNNTSDYYGGIGGIAGLLSNSTLTIQNCYNRGNISNSYNSSYAGQILGRYWNTAPTVLNSYYLSTATGVNTYGGTSKTAAQLNTLASTLGSAFKADTSNKNGGYPILSWE